MNNCIRWGLTPHRVNLLKGEMFSSSLKQILFALAVLITASASAQVIGQALMTGGTAAQTVTGHTIYVGNNAVVTATGNGQILATGGTSGTAGALGKVIATSQIAGMHNDWQDWIYISGTAALVSDGTGAYLTSGGTPHAIYSGTTLISLTAGTSTFANTSGTFSLSGTSFPVFDSGRRLSIFSILGNETGSLVILGGTGTDDWATVQPFFGSVNHIFVDSDFALSKSLRPGPNGGVWEGDTVHGPHMLAHADMGVIQTISTGSSAPTRDWTCENVVLDGNEMMQDTFTESLDPWNIQGDPINTYWVYGFRLENCENCHFNNNLCYSSATFNLFANHFNGGSIIGNKFSWRYYNGPPYAGSQPLHHDGIHLDGPAKGNDISGNLFVRGDDDQLAALPVETTPEAGDIAQLSTRRGHGGQVRQNLFSNNVFDNTRSGIRQGQQAATSGTALSENIVADNTYLANSGTIYRTMSVENVVCLNNHYSGWAIKSGTTQAGAINFGTVDINTPTSTVDGMPVDVAVQTFINAFANNDVSGIGGGYGAELANLKTGVLASWRMQDGTDSSGLAGTLTGSNGTPSFTATASGRKTAVYSGTGSLVLSGTAMPRLDLLPQWTVSGQFMFNSVTSRYASILTTGSASSGVFQLSVDTGNGNQFFMANNAAQSYYQGIGFSGTGHWYSFVVRKRATDGQLSVAVNQPTGDVSFGSWTAFTFPAYTILEIGGDTFNGRYMNGQVGNVTFHNRCVTDREAALLINPNQDGNADGENSPPISGRFWPFNY